jgi:hypothetical protein
MEQTKKGRKSQKNKKKQDLKAEDGGKEQENQNSLLE